MKANLLIVLSCLVLLSGCCSYSRFNDDFECGGGCGGGGGCSACSIAYAQPGSTCGLSHSCYDEACIDRSCGHEFDNVGQYGCPTCLGHYMAKPNCY